MTAWFVIVVPLVILFFALFMERVEARLSRLSVRAEEVEEFLDTARPDEVNELFDTGTGIDDTLDKFRDRRGPSTDGVPRTEVRRPAELGAPVGSGAPDDDEGMIDHSRSINGQAPNNLFTAHQPAPARPGTHPSGGVRS